MPNHRERMYGESSERLRTGSEEDADPDPRSQSGAGVLVEEIPPMGRPRNREELLSRPEWQLAHRVAASRGFCKSEFLPRFLLYVCEQYLLGETQEITEQRIGTQIFNRSMGYNPGEDNIVRSYARLLRKRLDEYFDGDGRDEPMRIVVPRGGYVPAFPSSAVTEADVSETDVQEEDRGDIFSETPDVVTGVPPGKADHVSV